MELVKESKKFNEIIETSLKNLSNMIDVNTVIGNPVKMGENEYVIPISKVTFGIMSGGGEYGKINIFKKGSDLPYSAGNGAIVSLKPCGFLIKNGVEDYKLVSVDKNAIDGLVDKSLEFIKKLKI